MPLSDGDSADDGDTWLRVLTVRRHLRSDGTLHHNAFSGSAIKPPPPDKNRRWSHEISGRLVSLAEDVEKEGKAFCESLSRATGQTKEFVGVAYARVEGLRAMVECISTDVCYTPLGHDPAHSDVVFFNSTDSDLDRLRDWLQEVLRPVKSNQLEVLKAVPHSPRPPPVQ
jgi:hypothetical protein